MVSTTGGKRPFRENFSLSISLKAVPLFSWADCNSCIPLRSVSMYLVPFSSTITDMDLTTNPPFIRDYSYPEYH